VIAAAALLCGCGAGSGEDDGVSRAAGDAPAAQEGRKGGPEPSVATARCPSSVSGCRSATGRIAYVERVDPDGDGDAHFVIVDLPGITLPGLTAIDVRRGLRPEPLPGPGDLVSAAGPVQVGSHGQSQIHALVLNVAR
jgi:hypothetical protein